MTQNKTGRQSWIYRSIALVYSARDFLFHPSPPLLKGYARFVAQTINVWLWFCCWIFQGEAEKYWQQDLVKESSFEHRKKNRHSRRKRAWIWRHFEVISSIFFSILLLAWCYKYYFIWFSRLNSISLIWLQSVILVDFLTWIGSCLLNLFDFDWLDLKYQPKFQ